MFIVAFCLCLPAISVSEWLTTEWRFYSTDRSEPFITAVPTQTPGIIRPTPQELAIASATPEMAGALQPTLQAPPVGQGPLLSTFHYTDTLEVLENTVVPLNDLRRLTGELKGIEEVPLTVEPPVVPLVKGDQKEFWVTNVDTNKKFRITASLHYITEHAYFWIQDGIKYKENDLNELAETFEQQIYPTNREFFGSEWTPGVDGDPRLYVLYTRGLGRNLAGYFSSADAYHPLVHEYSNVHEMFLLNADNLSLRDEFTYGVLAHEFQHMIHWHQDRNEESWLNEGFSELAAFLNGYYSGNFDYAYTRNPDIQLNDWPNNSRPTRPHYGAAFLFVTYFLDRFGEEATKALVAHQANGMTSIDAVLAENNATDLLTGEPLGANDVFLDWVITSYLQDETVGDGRFTYSIYPDAPQPNETESILSCPLEPQIRDVHQYGVNYIRINCEGEYTLRFVGSLQVPVVPANPFSGDYAFWSNRGDESEMTLVRTFDFSEHDGPLTFNYWTWYDLEKDYDYLYLQVSLDGERWQILTTPSGTADNPSGNSFGWAYNGVSSGWIHESVDLSQFAGQEIRLRFQYITDAAVNGEGFLLDDVEIPEIGYFADFENDDGGWEAQGWARIQNILPQFYRLAIITVGKESTVEYLALEPDNSINVPLSLGDEIDEVILVVTGTTRFTREKAAYQFELHP